MLWTETLGMEVLPSAQGWTGDVVGSGASAAVANGILTTTDTGTGTPSRSSFSKVPPALDVASCTLETRCRRTAGNNGQFGNYIAVGDLTSTSYLELISTGLRWQPTGATLAVDWASFHTLQISKAGSVSTVWVDGVAWLTGVANGGASVSPLIFFGAGASAQTGTTEWDYLRFLARRALDRAAVSDPWLRDDSPMVMG